MADITSVSETRTFDRILTFTRDHFLPGIEDHAFNASPAASIFFGKILGDYGSQPMTGKAFEKQTGGESIAVRMNLGKGNATRMSGPYDKHPTSPSHTVGVSRANWKHYSSNVTLSDTDKLTNMGPEALSSMLQFEHAKAMDSLVDLVCDDIYDNGGVSTAITDLSSVISASDSVQGLSGATYSDFNARGVSARGTAAASVSFAATGGFASTGVKDMRSAYHNAQEGNKKPTVVLSSFTEYEFYEAALTPEQRFTGLKADGSFTALSFKAVPYFPDDKAPVGTQWFLRPGESVKVIALSGAAFDWQDFKQATEQEVHVSELQFKGNVVVSNRKIGNKVTGVTA